MRPEDFAHRLEAVLSPFVLFPVLFATVAAATSDGPFRGMLYVACMTAAAGAVVLHLRRRTRMGLASGFWLSRRAERRVPAVVLLLCAGMLVAVLYLLDAPDELKALTTTAFLAAALAAAVTFLWQISAHATVAGHAAVWAVAVLGIWSLPFLLALPVVLWSRVAMGAHTLAQVLAGGFLGAFVAAAFILVG